MSRLKHNRYIVAVLVLFAVFGLLVFPAAATGNLPDAFGTHWVSPSQNQFSPTDNWRLETQVGITKHIAMPDVSINNQHRYYNGYNIYHPTGNQHADLEKMTNDLVSLYRTGNTVLDIIQLIG